MDGNSSKEQIQSNFVLQTVVECRVSSGVSKGETKTGVKGTDYHLEEKDIQ